MTTRISRVCGYVATASLVLSACGGGGSSSTSATTRSNAGGPTGIPKPSETIGQFAKRLTVLYHDAATGNCAPVKAYNTNESAGFGLVCNQRARRLYKGFRVTATQQFGTGGVIDFTDAEAPHGATAYAAVTPNGRFGTASSVIWAKTPAIRGVKYASHQVGTKPIDIAEQTKAVNQFITAVRNGDCHTYFTLGLTPTQNEKQECYMALQDPKSHFRPDFRSDPSAHPVLLGGVQGALFFGFLKGSKYRTLISLPGSPPVAFVVDSVHGA